MDFYPGGIDREAAQANPPADVKRCCMTCDRMYREWGASYWRCDRYGITEPETDVCDRWLWNCPQ